MCSKISPAAAAIELAPPSGTHASDLAAAFGRRAPVEVDLGCGDGSFLVQLAAQSSERNFLGIEQLAGRVRSACEKGARQKLRNLRIIRTEISSAVLFLPPESVSVVYLLFPDPWPKRRHHPRRIVTEDWLQSIARALVPGGLVHVATDHADYFQWMERALLQTPALESCAPAAAALFPATTFEKRFLEQGVAINRMTLRKTSQCGVHPC